MHCDGLVINRLISQNVQSRGSRREGLYLQRDDSKWQELVDRAKAIDKKRHFLPDIRNIRAGKGRIPIDVYSKIYQTLNPGELECEFVRGSGGIERERFVIESLEATYAPVSGEVLDRIPLF